MIFRDVNGNPMKIYCKAECDKSYCRLKYKIAAKFCDLNKEVEKKDENKRD